MRCPTCGGYGDLVFAKVKSTGDSIIVCTECDLLWESADPDGTTIELATDVSSFLKSKGLPTTWNELEILPRTEQ